MAGLGFETALAIGRRATVTRPGFALDGAGLPPGVTLTRASVASCHDATGTLVSVAADAARIDHDPASGAVRGLLIEPAATNLLSWSDGTVAQLGTANGVANAPGTIAGFANAIRFAGDAATRYAYKQYVPVVGQTLTLSVVVQMDDGGPPSIGATTVSGDFCLLAGSKLLDVPVTITSEASDAYRCSMTCTTSTTQGNWGVVRYPGQSARGFRITGMQLEAGDRATSYIATAGAAATRAADVLTLDWSTVGVGGEAIAVRYQFGDGSEAVVATDLADGVAPAPTTLARPWLRRAERW